MADSLREVLQAEIDKTARKLDALKNALDALDGSMALPISSPSTPTISPREFEGMSLAAAVIKLLTMHQRPMAFDEMMPLLKSGRAEFSKEYPQFHMRNLKTAFSMNSKRDKSWHKLRVNEETGAVSLRVWDKGRVKSESAAPVSS